MKLTDIIDLAAHDIGSADYVSACRDTLDRSGVLALPGFIRDHALSVVRAEAREGRSKAFFCKQKHSVYLTKDAEYPEDHPANRSVVSSKGCICDDDVPKTSPLRTLYDSVRFRDFVRGVTGETSLHAYADSLSSINIHYAERGQELGWHFDNSSFAITLLIQKPQTGSRFEYVTNLRNAAAGEMNYNGVADLLDGKLSPKVLDMEPGTLVLFRGRDSIHRVSPNESDTTRVLAVLAYNAEPGVSLSESARMTFYGRLS